MKILLSSYSECFPSCFIAPVSKMTCSPTLELEESIEATFKKGIKQTTINTQLWQGEKATTLLLLHKLAETSLINKDLQKTVGMSICCVNPLTPKRSWKSSSFKLKLRFSVTDFSLLPSTLIYLPGVSQHRSARIYCLK